MNVLINGELLCDEVMDEPSKTIELWKDKEQTAAYAMLTERCATVYQRSSTSGSASRLKNRRRKSQRVSLQSMW